VLLNMCDPIIAICLSGASFLFPLLIAPFMVCILVASVSDFTSDDLGDKPAQFSSWCRSMRGGHFIASVLMIQTPTHHTCWHPHTTLPHRPTTPPYHTLPHHPTIPCRVHLHCDRLGDPCTARGTVLFRPYQQAPP
jgi:hypothetical protein